MIQRSLLVLLMLLAALTLQGQFVIPETLPEHARRRAIEAYDGKFLPVLFEPVKLETGPITSVLVWINKNLVFWEGEGVATVIVREDYFPYDVFLDGPYKDTHIHHAIKKMAIDCRDLRYQIRELTSYSPSGEAVGHGKAPEDEEWLQSIPGSVGEIKHKRLCGAVEAITK